jgi:hypothetical protein
MKRRDFIRVTSAAGMAGLVDPSFNAIAAPGIGPETGFDLHPFIREHPEAVFINLTSVGDKGNKEALHDAAYKLASEIFIKTTDQSGFPNTTVVTGKPNWTCSGRVDPKDPLQHLGITTDLNFVEGFLKAVKNKGPEKIFIRECACPTTWEALGYYDMARRNNFDLQDLTSRDFWNLPEGAVTFHEVDRGVVFKEIGFMAPMNEPGSFLINLAKFKAHSMGITGAVKNLQGIAAKRFHQFCGGQYDIFKTYDQRYHRFFYSDYLQKVDELHMKHLKEGMPRWASRMDRPPNGGGFFMEQWIQRMLDSYSVTPTGINVVEGIYGRDGDGFAAGPHDGKAKDYMSNNIIFGKDPFRVDIITHWLAGHEPGNFGLFHIGIERGFSDVLDPSDIPVYLWENGQAKKVSLDIFNRTPLVTPYLRRNYDGLNEDQYHLVNEAFDYTNWKKTGKIPNAEKPSIRVLGNNANNGIVMEVNMPEESDVYVDIKNKLGDVVWRLRSDRLQPGVHEVVWDGFSEPGLYTMYVKGMGWDSEKQMVIFT